MLNKSENVDLTHSPEPFIQEGFLIVFDAVSVTSCPLFIMFGAIVLRPNILLNIFFSQFVVFFVLCIVTSGLMSAASSITPGSTTLPFLNKLLNEVLTQVLSFLAQKLLFCFLKVVVGRTTSFKLLTISCFGIGRTPNKLLM